MTPVLPSGRIVSLLLLAAALTVGTTPSVGAQDLVPQPFVSIYHPDVYTEATVEIGVESGDTPQECAEATRDPITITVTSGSIRERARIDGSCGKWTTNRRRRKHRTFILTYENVNPEQASLVRIALRGRVHRRRVKFRYAVAWHGRTLRRGTVTGVTRSQRGHDVYEGTDAFVNYCINEAQKIYSYQGRLYCWYPGYLHRSWKVTRVDS